MSHMYLSIYILPCVLLTVLPAYISFAVFSSSLIDVCIAVISTSLLSLLCISQHVNSQCLYYIYPTVLFNSFPTYVQYYLFPVCLLCVSVYLQIIILLSVLVIGLVVSYVVYSMKAYLRLTISVYMGFYRSSSVYSLSLVS